MENRRHQPSSTAKLKLTRFVETLPTAQGKIVRHVTQAKGVPATAAILRTLHEFGNGASVQQVRASSAGSNTYDIELMQHLGLLIPADQEQRDYEHTYATMLARLDSKVSQHPQLSHIEASSKCQASCTMCPKGCGHMIRPSQHLPLALFTRVLDQWAELACEPKSFVNMHAFGEPLLNPQIAKMVAQLVAAGFLPTLGSNGLVVNKKRVEACMQAGLSLLWVSVDAVDAHSYKQIRGQHVELATVEAFVKWAAATIQSRGYLTKLVVQLINMQQNSQQIKDFIDSWQKIDEVHPFIQVFQGMPDINPEFDVSLNYPIRPLICPLPWTGPHTVLSNGALVACCIDYNGETRFGDLKQRELGELLRPESRRAVQERALRAMLLRDPSHVCGRCRNSWYDPEQLKQEQTVFNNKGLLMRELGF